jgi:hypothetical protein
MNLCKDCKHFTKEGNATLCNATAISLIDGESRHSVDHCAKARGRNGRCGLEGRMFDTLVLVDGEIEVEVFIDQTVGLRGTEVLKATRKPKVNKPSVVKETTDGQAE